MPGKNTVLTTEQKSIIQRSPIVVVADVETTGFSRDKGASLLEIGAVKLDVANEKILGKFNSFIHPQTNFGKVPAKITELTGITQQDADGAPEQEEVMEAFRFFIGAYPLVFHNADFDWSFLRPALMEIGTHPINPILDTLAMSHSLHPTMRKHGLKELTAYYGHPIEGHHRAVVDAKYTAALYVKMRSELLSEPTQFQGMEWMAKASPHYPVDDLKISRVRYWKNGKRERIYVTTNNVVFYYDITRRQWVIQRMAENYDFDRKECGQVVLERMNLSLDEFVKKYRAG